MDIPSPQAGVVKEVKVKVGDKIAKDSLILLLEAADTQTQQQLNLKLNLKRNQNTCSATRTDIGSQGSYFSIDKIVIFQRN